MSNNNVRNTNSQGKLGNLADIAIEETGVGNNGFVGKGLDSGSGSKGRTGFVESNMTIGTNTSQEEFNTTNTSDLGLELLALFVKIGSVSVQNVDIFRLNINMLEKVVPHERVIRFRMVSA